MTALIMIAKMSIITLVYICLTFLLWKKFRDRELGTGERILIGLIYGAMSILSTHFGVNYNAWVLNVRDLGPMSAGLMFDPVSGIIAGLIGGIERFIAGTYWGVAPFTRVACSISTILAGFLSAFLNKVVFNGKRPSDAYALFMGAVIEVFHMYVIFITHRDDMDAAFHVVKTCAVPMIVFSSLGLALSSIAIRVSSGEWRDPFKKRQIEEIPVLYRFQIWLFIVTIAVFILNYSFNYTMQTQIAIQESQESLIIASKDITGVYKMIKERGGHVNRVKRQVGYSGSFYLYEKDGTFTSSLELDEDLSNGIIEIIKTNRPGEFFSADLGEWSALCRIEELDDGTKLLVLLPESEVYETRDIQGYETLFADILVFTVIFVLISLLVQTMVVDKLKLVNESLDKITRGELNEKVNVYSSSEFMSLSDDINQTVDALKGYIDAAETRIEQELMLAHTIQDSALLKSFDFNHPGFEVYATMDPAREVGGDFYDCFFVNNNKIAIVIADVAGKGIPASLLMMRSKTAIRSLAETGTPLVEVIERVNNELFHGNEADMFVTVWMGIVDLSTGDIKAVNAGHEYPALKRRDGRYELLRDKHRPPLGAVEDMTYTEYDIHLDPGDCLYVYTDGIPEAINEKVEAYGTDRMLEVLSNNSSAAMKDLLHAVKNDIDEFAGKADKFDDITMIGLRYFGPGGIDV